MRQKQLNTGTRLEEMQYFNREVRLKGRSRLIYTEGNRKMTIGIEMETGDVDFVVYLSEVRGWGGDESLKLSVIEIERVKTNIGQEMLKNGLKIEWV